MFSFPYIDNGWQTKLSFENYVKHHLYPELKERGVEFPVIYFVDGHSSHSSFELFKWCRDHQIIFILSYPNSTHITQPCDTSIFGPLKRAWPVEVSKYERETGGNITLVDFVKIMKRLHDKVMKPEAVINGFRMCGIFPLDADNVHYDRCIAVAAYESTVVGPLIDETSQNATIIAVGSDKDVDSVPTINTPTVDEIFSTTQADWDVALEQPFIVVENEHDPPFTGSRVLNILNQIKSNLGDLQSALIDDRVELSSSAVVMEQLCDFLIKNVSKDPQVTSPSPAPQSSTTEQQPPKKTLSQILKRPPRPERSKIHRKYGKIPKFGVMSSDEVVKQFEEDQAEKENLKENKRMRQQEIAALQEKIKMLRKTQKDINESAKQKKSIEPNKLKTSRGRKRKATEALTELSPNIVEVQQFEPEFVDYNINLYER